MNTPIHLYRFTTRKPSFIFTIDTRGTHTGSTDSFSYQLPLNNNFGIWNFTVFWGDGTQQVVTGNGALVRTHTYPIEGIYTIVMEGEIKGIKSFSAERNKMLSITQFGGSGFIIDARAIFQNHANLELVTLTDAPLIEFNASTGAFAHDTVFSNCTNLTKVNGIEKWDMLRAGSLGNYFINCSKYIGQVPIVPTTNTVITSYLQILFNCTLWNNDVVGRLPILPQITAIGGMFSGTAMSAENYSKFVIYWANMVHAQGGLPANLNFTNGSTIKYNSVNYGGTPYNNAPDAIAYLQSCGWTVTNGGQI
jgi:hypothetical protein